MKTFCVNAPDGGKLFEHMPGQCAMLCAPGVSEGMFSITSSPTNKEYQEFSIKRCGDTDIIICTACRLEMRSQCVGLTEIISR